jgi:tRNA U34 5-carboxymethylaminomethyl modifying GTPase MnmE/TrmE
MTTNVNDLYDHLFKSIRIYLKFNLNVWKFWTNIWNIYKVIIIGDSGTGKTSILNRYTQKEFSIESKTTIGTFKYFLSIKILYRLKFCM